MDGILACAVVEQRFAPRTRGDLVLHAPASGAFVTWLLKGGAAPRSAPLQSIPATWNIAGVGDFNGDKRADLIFHQPTHQITVRLMNGTVSGAFTNLGAIAPTWTIVTVW